ncbi:MAG TPA: helix-turn-helix domain-containing protein, partial [Solirubrobacterales bacterium]
HLGCVAWGKGADEAIRRLSTRLGRPAQLTLRLHNNWWGWLSGPRPLEPDQLRELRRFDPPPGIRIAFGLEGFGESGFRSTNHQALRAQWVAPPGPAMILYEDVAVETLATEAEADARAFVAHELHGIDDPSAASARLRETLAAYFAAEMNAASAGAALGVHHQTVTNRLRVIEGRIGHSLGSRHLELAIALRLRATLRAEGP